MKSSKSKSKQVPRLPTNPTNGDLANAIYRLELRSNRQDEALEELRMDLAPLKESMTEVLGVVKFIRAAVAALGVIGTLASVWAALHGH